MLDHARSISASIQAAARGCGDEGVMRAMEPLIILYGRPKLSQGEQSAWLDIYFEKLGDLPLEALEYAIDAYILETEFKVLPTPGKLVKLAEEKAAEIRKAAYRIKMALEERPVADRAPPTPEERQKVKDLMAELKAVPKSADIRKETQAEMAERLRRTAAL